MVWTEIDVNRPLSDAEMRAAVGKAFGIAAARVLAVSNLADIPALDPHISIVVEHSEQQGDFPERLTLVIWDGSLQETFGSEETSLASYATLTALAAHLDASIIAADDNPDPYTGLLIEPSGDVFQVHFDADVLDDLGGVSISDEFPKVPVPTLSHLPQRHALTS
jgi:hypothetical protein